jgi:hypothetical protein
VASTVTVTSARPGIRRVRAGGKTFPVGEPVPNVAQKTIDVLQEMPGVTVDVAGKDQPDADTPETTDEE